MTRNIHVGLVVAALWLVPDSLGAQQPDHHAVAEGAFEPTLTMRGFSDVTFRGERFQPTTGPSETASTFGLGQFSFFLSAHIAENVSVVSETAFVVGTDVRQSTSVILERIYVKYVLTDAVKIAVGRTHTALGYWNEAYHHGALLHPTVARPEILRFGGVMPVHSVGLEVSGRLPVRGWDINYVGNLANGRARDFSATQGAADVNSSKAAAAKLSIAYESNRTVIFGPMIYHDVIPSDPTRPGRESEVTETIAGGHFVFRDPRFEFLSEYFKIRHVARATAMEVGHEGWYAIAIGRPWRSKPYVGIDVAQFTAGDEYFAGGDMSVRRYLAGIRYDVNPLNALKFEYRHEHRAAGDTHALVINTAFAF